MADAPAPKFDFKMLVMPAVFYFSRQFDMTKPEVIDQLRMIFGTVFALLFGVYLIAYLRVSGSKNNKKIWVPPKPQPKLPFGLGPAETPLTAKDYKETTYAEHEMDLIKSEVGSMVMSCVITLAMSFKFNIHLSLLMQSVMTPMNAFDSLVLKKYLLGATKGADGGNLYKELLAPPSDSVDFPASKNDDQTFSEVSPMFKKGEARVEELPDEDTKPKKKDSKTASSKSSDKSSDKKATSTSAAELD